jgi:hypothetical protein
MRGITYRHFRELGACGAAAILLMGAASPEDTTQSGQYRFAVVKSVPDLPLSYDLRLADFQRAFPRASAPIIEAEMGKGNNYGFVRKDGSKFSAPLDVATIPEWVYAEYLDNTPDYRCRYVLIDGLRPDAYKPLPAVGDIEVVPDEVEPAVLRNCGSGFEIVSRENFSSIFAMSFESESLTDRAGPLVGDNVPKGLAHDYVQRLIVAFGGKDALKRKLEQLESKRSGWRDNIARHYPVLRSALVDLDIVKAPE